MGTKWNFSSIFLKSYSSGTAGVILEKFHENIPWVTFFKNCSRNFYPSINMTLVNGSFVHYTEHEEILKKSSLLKPLVRFRNNFTGIQKVFAKF